MRDVSKLDDAIASDQVKQLNSQALTQASGLTGRFYSKKSFSHPPAWVNYVDPVVSGGIQGIRSASSSGLLLLEVAGKTFGLTFGYGRNFLNQAKIERRFGLKVVLNLID